MRKEYTLIPIVIGLTVALSLPELSFTQARTQTQPPRTRPSQRVRMREVQVASPEGKLKFTILPNAERLTYTVMLGNTTVLESSPIIMIVEGYDLSSGVVFDNLERYEVKETYPWRGTRSKAVNQCNGVKVSLVHDLSFASYTLEVRVFNDGVAFRHVIPSEEGASRVPDEYSTLNIPAGATVWYAGMAEGHYEAPYSKKNISEVQAGEWAGPPLTFELPLDAGYASITEANLVSYSGMGLEADGHRGWVVGLGHRQPLTYPFELRYGREEGKRLGKAASITGTITTPWRVVMVGRNLSTLVDSTILPNLCPPPDAKLFPEGIKTAWINGRAVWRYVDGGPTGVDGMKEFSHRAGRFECHCRFWATANTGRRSCATAALTTAQSGSKPLPRSKAIRSRLRCVREAASWGAFRSRNRWCDQREDSLRAGKEVLHT